MEIFDESNVAVKFLLMPGDTNKANKLLGHNKHEYTTGNKFTFRIRILGKCVGKANSNNSLKKHDEGG